MGMRNATLMAVAPNANIGLLVGTTPGFDPRFAQVFSRNKISGKYMDVNHNLVKDLKNMGLWDTVKESIIEHMGDISEIPGIPQHIKDIYKTSFTTSPYGFIEVAARAQKWVDQALSRNMYLETRDTDEILKIYMTAWKKGLKSTYYLHMKPRHSAEQSTTKVNKTEKMGKTAFGAFTSTRKTADVLEGDSANDNTLLAEAGILNIQESVLESKSESKIGPFSSIQPTPAPITEPIFKTEIMTPIQQTSKPSIQTSDASDMASVTIEVPEPAVVISAMPEPVTSAMPLGPKIFVSKNPIKVCPTDPQELLQCDSCQ
jgi:ribonucleoside-diphosphate reductase alpha chain